MGLFRANQKSMMASQIRMSQSQVVPLLCEFDKFLEDFEAENLGRFGPHQASLDHQKFRNRPSKPCLFVPSAL